MVMVTATSDNHYLSALSWLSNARRTNPEIPLVVFSLGLTAENLVELACYCAAQVYVFDFSVEPRHAAMDQQDAGAYSWKPVIIGHMLSLYDVVIWSDSGNRWNATLEPFVAEAHRRNGLYSGNVWGRLGQLMHPHMYERHYNDSGFRRYFNNRSNRNCDAAFVVVTQQARPLVDEWVKCARVKECILPTGAGRRNHRWDQSALAYLVYSDRFRSLTGQQRYTCTSGQYHDTLTRWNDALLYPSRNASVVTAATHEACAHHVSAVFAALEGADGGGGGCVPRNVDTSAVCALGPLDGARRVLVVSASATDECTALAVVSTLAPASSLVSLRVDRDVVGGEAAALFASALDAAQTRYCCLGRASMTRVSAWPNGTRFDVVVLASPMSGRYSAAWREQLDKAWPRWGVVDTGGVVRACATPDCVSRSS